jgi:sigma-B regulation protein RsbU (phosphoserine phosphatase)
VTLFLAQFDPSTQSLTYSSAGHCPGYVLNTAGDVKAILDSTATPLGLLAGRDFPASGELFLEPGDLLFLHTDGVVDAGATGEAGVFGSNRALSLVREHRHRPPLEILDTLFDAVSAFSDAEEVADDATAVIIKVEAPCCAGQAPPAVATGVVARRWTRYDTQQERHPPRRDDAKGWR